MDPTKPSILESLKSAWRFLEPSLIRLRSVLIPFFSRAPKGIFLEGCQDGVNNSLLTIFAPTLQLQRAQSRSCLRTFGLGVTTIHMLGARAWLVPGRTWWVPTAKQLELPTPEIRRWSRRFVGSLLGVLLRAIARRDCVGAHLVFVGVRGFCLLLPS